MTNENTLCNSGNSLSLLYGDLPGKEIQNRRDRCIRTADSCCCTVETNTLQSNYISIKINFKNKTHTTYSLLKIRIRKLKKKKKE